MLTDELRQLAIRGSSVAYESSDARLPGGYVPDVSFTEIGQLQDDLTGFRAVAFVNRRDNEAMLCFAGTELSAQDAFSDLLLGANQWDNNREDVLGYLIDTLSAGGSVTLVGHSLGGALAQYAAYDLSIELLGNGQLEEYASKIRVVTFNGLGGHAGLYARYLQDFNPTLLTPLYENINHFYVQGDFVSRLGEGHVGGRVYEIPNMFSEGVRPLDPLDAHGLSTVQNLLFGHSGIQNVVQQSPDYVSVSGIQRIAAELGGLLNGLEAEELEASLRLAGAVIGTFAIVSRVPSGFLGSGEIDTLVREVALGFASALTDEHAGKRFAFRSLALFPWEFLLSRTPPQLLAAASGSALGAAAVLDLLEVGREELIEHTRNVPGMQQFIDLMLPSSMIADLMQFGQQYLMDAWDIAQAVIGDKTFLNVQAENLTLEENGNGILQLEFADRAAKARGEVLIAVVSDPDRIVLEGPGVIPHENGGGRYRIEVLGGATEQTVSVRSLADADGWDNYVMVRIESPPLSSLNPALDDESLSMVWIDVSDTMESDKSNLIVGTDGDNNSGSFWLGGFNALNGTDSDDEVRGLAGDDDLLGKDGNDWLRGGEGNDWLVGGHDEDLLDGGDGQDALFGGAGNDALFGGAGPDALHGGEGLDRLNGGQGGDLLVGAAGDDQLTGGDGDDMLDGDGSAQPVGRGWKSTVVLGAVPLQASAVPYQVKVPLAFSANEWFISDGASDEGSPNASDGADVLRGEAGNDLLAGWGGDDYLSGGTHNDALFGGWGNDWLQGGSHDDWLSGHRGHDRLQGESGHDSLYGGRGNDQLDGGAGHDLLVGDLWDGKNGADGLDGRDTLYGGDGNDELYGNGGNDQLDGGNGDDLLLGGSGSDLLHGRAGADRIDAGASADFVDGGEGNDWLHGGDGGDFVTGGAGADELAGDEGNDTLLGDLGADLLFGGAGDDRLDGGAGNDQLVGGAGADELDGGDGDDVLIGLAVGSKAFDPGNLLRGGAGNDYLEGADGADTLLGGSDDDQALGGGGDDLLDGGGGADILRGGAGDDQITAGDGADQLWGNDGADRLLGGSGRDRLFGGKGDDLLGGGPGDDMLEGQEGNDVYEFESGGGFDQLIDVIGSNRLRFPDLGAASLNVEQGPAGVVIRYGGGEDGLFLDTATFRSLAQLSYGHADQPIRLELTAAEGGDGISGSGAGDILHAASTGSRLEGLGGDDILRGAPGNDWLAGGPGDDVLVGGPGHDRLIGGLGDDRYEFGPGSGFDRIVAAAAPLPLESVLGKDQLWLRGVDPGDVQPERRGADLRITLRETGDVVVVDQFFAVRDHALSSIRFDSQHGQAWSRADLWQRVLVGGSGNDWLEGHETADVMRGGAGSDLVYGAAGDDRLNGGPGRDTLVGGAGDDVYELAPGAGVDTVARFRSAWPQTGFDVVELASGIGPNDLLVVEQGAGADRNLLIMLRRSGDAISVDDYSQPGADGGFPVDALRFADASEWRLAEVERHLSEQRSIVGSIGDDQLALRHNERLALGLGGDDYLQATDTAVVLHGGGGEDTLLGSREADVLIGGAGRDLLNGGAGDDNYVLHGSERGIDTFDAFLFAAESDEGEDTVLLRGVQREDVRSHTLADVVAGHDWGLALRWGPGDDRGLDLTATGVEWVKFDDERVSVTTLLAELSDAWRIRPDSYRYPGGFLLGGSTTDSVSGTSYADALVGYGGDDLLRGAEGDDQLAGGPGADRLEGGPGNDTLAGGVGGDVLIGGNGDDLYVFSASTAAVDRVVPQLSWGLGEDQGMDSVRVEGLAEQSLTVSVAVDWFGSDSKASSVDEQRYRSQAPGVAYLTLRWHAERGVDLYATGIERISIEEQERPLVDLLAAVTESPIEAPPAQLQNAQGGIDWSASFYGATLIGTEFSDQLSGSGGADLLFGFGGDDLLAAGAGRDYLDGGRGDDRYRVSESDGHVSIRDVAGTDRIELPDAVAQSLQWVSDGPDLVWLVDEVERGRVLGGFQDGTPAIEFLEFDNGTVTALADVLPASLMDGPSHLGGRAATLVLESGRLNQASLEDRVGVPLDGEAVGPIPGWLDVGPDAIEATPPEFGETGPSTSVVLESSTRGTIRLPVEIIPSRTLLVGTDEVDQIHGTLAHEGIPGRAGDDAIWGGDGHDLLAGGDGSDLLVGGPGHDVLFGGAHEDRLRGANGDDHLAGGKGADLLQGGNGRDLLVGGPGNDRLRGGPGADAYHFGRGDGADRIEELADGSTEDDWVRFGPELRPEDLIFRRTGDRLRIDVAGSPDRLEIDAWFSDQGPTLAGFETTAGDRLLAADVGSLIEATAALDSLRSGAGGVGWIAESERLALAESAWLQLPWEHSSNAVANSS